MCVMGKRLLVYNHLRLMNSSPMGSLVWSVFISLCVHVLSSSSRMSCHPAAADGLQRKLAQRAGAFFLPNDGANESSVSPFPRNLAGSRASFPLKSVKSPKIPMLTGLL